MLLDTKIWKEDGFWVGLVPALDASTQGHTKKELLSMLEDLVTNMIPTKATVGIAPIKGEVYIEVNPSKAILPVILKRQRMKAGLTVREVAKRLGYTSHNNYSAYETGKMEPSFEKFQELLRGIISEEVTEYDPVALRLVVGE